MLQSFLTSLREALQCTLLLSLLFLHPAIRDKRLNSLSLLCGTALAFLAGFFLSYIPGISDHIWDNNTWTMLRYCTEISIYFAGAVLVIRGFELPERVNSMLLGLLGFLLFFFEARALGFHIHDAGLMSENVSGTLMTSLLGTLAGLSLLFLTRKTVTKIPLQSTLMLPVILVSVAALKFIIGGVGELEDGYLVISLQKGLLDLTENSMDLFQSLLLLPEHPFIKTPFAEAAAFLSGDRMAMTLTVILMMTPPVLILVRLYAIPDPVFPDAARGAERRLRIAFFRKELVFQSTPVILAIVVLIILIHSVNVSLNPMYAPAPLPVREAEGSGAIRIPLADRMGDLSDGKLRKYVYYYGNKEIIFLAILKPDGSVGVALDQCEICKPADWNKAAQGYSQRGDHLVCNYCMTPIALPTVGNPGGCNPIPLPFRLEDDHIVIETGELVRVFKAAESLEKEGTHL